MTNQARPNTREKIQSYGRDAKDVDPYARLILASRRAVKTPRLDRGHKPQHPRATYQVLLYNELNRSA